MTIVEAVNGVDRAAEEEIRLKIKAATELCQALGASIRELGSIPEGRLYAAVMSRMSLEEFTAAINLLERLSIVERTQMRVLKWIGNCYGHSGRHQSAFE